MMKPIYKTALILLTIPLWAACSEEKGAEGAEDILINGIAAQIGDRTAETGISSRAGEDFAVNTANDPTLDVTRLQGGGDANVGTWQLEAAFFDYNDQPYTPADGTWAYTGSNIWTPSTVLYLPSYFKPRVTANLFPSDRTVTDLPETDQSTALNLLRQDLLVQQTDPYTVTPAHVLTIGLKHQYSMLDIILEGVNTNDIASVTIVANGQTYIPYNIPALLNEYLVILPTGVANPQVIVRTQKGAEYTETLNVSSAISNYCYCIKLTGVDLILTSVTVIDWTYGSALSGQYTTPTSYPTFRGTENSSVTVYYDNGLSQDLEFDQRGETTEKPYGRTIIQVGALVLDSPIILDEMYIDLRTYMATP